MSTKRINRRQFAAGLASAQALMAQSQAPRRETAQSRSTTPPHLFRQFTPLPPGSIRSQGWLARYVQINADGWVLAHAKARMPAVFGRHFNRTSNPDLGFTDNDEWVDAPDYGAYYGDALVHYAQHRPGTELATHADDWVKQLVASQDSDGYIGGFTPGARWQCWLEIFSQSLLLNALLFRYEASGDEALLAACERSADLMMGVWRNPPAKYRPGIFSGHGVVIVRTAATLYRLTGNEKYRDFAREVLDRYGKVKAYLQPGNAVVHNHNVVEAEHVGFPADVHDITGDADLLKASQAGWEMMQRYLSIDGQPYGNEPIFQTGSRANGEHCAAVDWPITSNTLLRITGEVKYADAVERTMYNGYPAPKTPDGMMVGYMHSPNQLVASEWSMPHENDGDLDWWASRQHYSTAHEPLCCNANGPRGLPFFVEWMAMRAQDGLVVSYYGPATVDTTLPGPGHVKLSMDTDYPFEDEIRITVDPDRAAFFPLRLRIPGWSEGATLLVNGTASAAPAKPGTYAVIERQWTRGDKVVLRLENRIRLVWRRRPEFKIRARCAALERGPLVYTLPVAEDWRPFVPPAHGPGFEIKACRLFPQEGAVWNYALLIDANDPGRSATLKKREVPADAKPWDAHAPVALEVKARRVLNWRMEGDPDHPKTPGFPFNPMQLSTAVETVQLVPFGCTRLRMTYLPIVAV